MPSQLETEHEVGPRGRENGDLNATMAEALRRRIGKRYDLWFLDNAKFSFQDGIITVGARNNYYSDWIQKTFTVDIVESAEEILGMPVQCRFGVDPQLFQQARQDEQAHATAGKRKTAKAKAVATQPLTEPGHAASSKLRSGKTTKPPRKTVGSRRWKTLNDFVAGDCNRLALAAAQSVVDDPAQDANPLVIYGPTGTGKSHLLDGVYVGLKRKFNDGQIMCLAAEDFVNRFVSSMHKSKQSQFRRQFRNCAALLVDDLNFLVGKEKTQVEFLHTFDNLLSDGCQIVVTMDCHPRFCEDLMPELLDRLTGGTIVGVLPPDEKTRLQVMRSKMATAGISIPEKVLKYLASRLRGNIREIEGAINTLKHYARVSGKTINLELAKDALGDLLKQSAKTITLEQIEVAICSVVNIGLSSLRSRSKAWSVSHARMLTIYLSRKHTPATFQEISRHYGNKTHSGAVAAEKKVRGWLDKNERIRCGDREWRIKDLIQRIERELGLI
ncbi:MAG: DnaA/Hda family protein [Zavarzinella sp.]